MSLAQVIANWKRPELSVSGCSLLSLEFYERLHSLKNMDWYSKLEYNM